MSWTEEDDYNYFDDEMYGGDYDEYEWNDHQQSYGEFENEFDDEDMPIDRDEYHEESKVEEAVFSDLERIANTKTLNRVFQLEGERELQILRLTLESVSVPHKQKDELVSRINGYIEKNGISEFANINASAFIYGALYSSFYESSFSDVSEYLSNIIGVRGDFGSIPYDTIRYSVYYREIISA